VTWQQHMLEYDDSSLLLLPINASALVDGNVLPL
jgi:hypothetical protein